MDATVSTPVSRGDLSAGMGRANNVEFGLNTHNYLYNREPEFYVYLYNVSEYTYTFSRPPLIKLGTIAGRKSVFGSNYILAARLPQPMLVPKGNVDSNEIDIVPLDTRRFAMDIVNPDNLGFDQNAVIQSTSIGNNLSAKGVFWSLNGPENASDEYIKRNIKRLFGIEVQSRPTEKELADAQTRMENYYRYLINQAKTTELADPKSINEVVTPEHHAAAEYYGEEHSWHSKNKRTDFCPNCGDRIKGGAAFHKTEEGTLCIIDWVRAVKAGVRTRAEAYDATGDEQFAPKVAAAPAPEAKPSAGQTPPKHKPPQGGVQSE